MNANGEKETFPLDDEASTAARLAKTRAAHRKPGLPNVCFYAEAGQSAKQRKKRAQTSDKPAVSAPRFRLWTGLRTVANGSFTEAPMPGFPFQGDASCVPCCCLPLLQPGSSFQRIPATRGKLSESSHSHGFPCSCSWLLQAMTVWQQMALASGTP